jgi:hypothetical protein
MYITLTFVIDNLDTVRKVYDTIELQKAESANGPWTTVTSGIDPVYPITLIGKISPFKIKDYNGTEDHWYRSCYYLFSNPSVRSGWSDPIRGETGEICYDPTYPVEVGYGTSEQLIIDRIRRLVGDPVGLKREYDERDNIHLGKKVYELGEGKGWPCSINIGDTTYNTTSNPMINGYRYLKFTDDDITTLSGAELKIDIFYYTFRNSDREIFEAYSTAYPPYPLTITTATPEVFMLQTSVTLLSQELIENCVEDGATIADEASRYSPDPGLGLRKAMIDKLQDRLDKLVKVLSWPNITGVLID